MPRVGLEVKAISATKRVAPGLGHPPTGEVTKLVDVSVCIGCKACEAACKEWNDLPPNPDRPFTGSYQTLPDLEYNFWQLIKFNEVERDGRLVWTLTKFQCMHCADPGCLRACPAPGAIVQYTNGIVDFVQENCIGCQFCVTGCPFDVPRISPTTGKVYKCTLCSDRVAAGLEPACVKACPTNAISFGTRPKMLAQAEERVQRLKADGYAEATVYNPPGVGGTHVIYVLPFGDEPELYGLPKNPRVTFVNLWKGPLKWLGNTVLFGGILGAVLHYFRFGPREVNGKGAEASHQERVQ
ncbi:MAG: formate dehydrogenase subunit beta [Armatimonadota bacterium]|nr:formate dehydrogenase subunit beta [Armatimonadota bacterium]